MPKMDLLRGIQEFIDSENLFNRKQQILLAVSGGVDSMVLTHLLFKLGYQLHIAHANYQLRGVASDQDEQLVQQLSQQLGIPFYSKRFDTSGYSKSNGISIQMAARELRYQWFKTLVDNHGIDKIATAHHLNDVLETVLLNLTRGTGIAGLHGIKASQENIARPLLFAKKDDLLSYALLQKINWREDKSNESNYYQRNLIRHQVIPILKQINPDIEATTQNTVEILSMVESEYQKVLKSLRQDLFIKDQHHVNVSKSKLKDMEPALFADLIRDYGFNLYQVKQILKKSFRHTGAVFETKSHVLNIDRDHIIITAKLPTPEVVAIAEATKGEIEVGNEKWGIRKIPAKNYQITEDPDCAVLDADKIKFPLQVRVWEPGDRFIPLGMKNHKKVSDFLIDRKVPLNFKKQVKVVTSDGRIIWLAGHRIDDRYKLTNHTNAVLEIKKY